MAGDISRIAVGLVLLVGLCVSTASMANGPQTSQIGDLRTRQGRDLQTPPIGDLQASQIYQPPPPQTRVPPTPRAAPWRLWFRSARLGSPNGVSVGPPGPQRYPQYATGYYPWYGYGLGVPTYNWGYFGANAHGTLMTGFRGYHENFWQFSVQRGY